VFCIEIEQDLKIALMQEFMAKELYQLVIKNKEHLSRWFPWIWDVNSENDSRAYIINRLELFAKGKSVYCGIVYKGKLVGVLDFVSIDKKNKKSDIGYWLDADHQGKGIMSKAVKTLINYGVNYLDLKKFIIICDTENRKSCNIAKRLAFSKEGLLKEHLVINKERRDFNLYALCI